MKGALVFVAVVLCFVTALPFETTTSPTEASI